MGLNVAKNGKSYFVTVAFQDEDGTAVTPTSATYTLRNGQGNIVNSKNATAISSLASSVTIVLTPSDTDLDDGEGRKIYVDYVYNSTNGTGLSGGDSESFQIEG